MLLSAEALATEPSPSAPLWSPAWPNFSALEGVATLAAAGGTLALALQGPPHEPRWTGGILFDDATRDTVRLSSLPARRTARRIGDWPYWTAATLPLIVDPLVALTFADDPRAAGNIALLGLEAFSYAGFLSFVSTRISKRERPDSTECRARGGADCEEDTEAFWSGHTSIVAASAGLVCAHHRFMPLWGGGVGDAGACVLASSGAVLTAATRVIADRHYASDVLVGLGVGFGIGYGVPVLLHYRHDSPTRIAVQLQPSEAGGATLLVAGRF